MNSKVGLIKVKVLVNSTTKQRKQYAMLSTGNQSRNIWRLDGDSTFLANIAHSACGLLL